MYYETYPYPFTPAIFAVWTTRRLLIRISGMTNAGQLSWNMNKYLEFFVFLCYFIQHLTTLQAIQHLSIVSSLDKARLMVPYTS